MKINDIRRADPKLADAIMAIREGRTVETRDPVSAVMRREHDARLIYMSLSAIREISRQDVRRERPIPSGLDDEILHQAIIGAIHGCQTYDARLGERDAHIAKQAEHHGRRFMERERKYATTHGVSYNEASPPLSLQATIRKADEYFSPGARDMGKMARDRDSRSWDYLESDLLAIRATIRTFPAPTQRLLIARYIDGMSQAKVAKRFRTSQPTINRREKEALAVIKSGVIADRKRRDDDLIRHRKWIHDNGLYRDAFI